jgi:hypothetical protein
MAHPFNAAAGLPAVLTSAIAAVRATIVSFDECLLFSYGV